MERVLWEESLTKLSILQHFIEILIKPLHEQNQLMCRHFEPQLVQPILYVINTYSIESLNSEDPERINQIEVSLQTQRHLNLLNSLL